MDRLMILRVSFPLNSRNTLRRLARHLEVSAAGSKKVSHSLLIAGIPSDFDNALAAIELVLSGEPEVSFPLNSRNTLRPRKPPTPLRRVVCLIPS